MKQRLFWTIALLAPFLGSCGSRPPPVGQAWDPREVRFFDDGMDVIADPALSIGAFGFRYKDLLEGRIQLSDFVAVVEIEAVRTSMDVDRNTVKHIEVRITNRLYGSRPEKRLSLRSDEHTAGYNLIARHEAHLHGRYLLFSRWFPQSGEEGETGMRFHLSPASPSMVAEVKSRLALRHELERR